MPVELNIKVDSKAVTRKFGRMARRRLHEALRKGFVRSLDYAASEVTVAAGQKLRQRSGNLMQSILPQPGAKAALCGYVGVSSDSPALKYAYLLTGQSVDIRPVKAKALTIPFGANITGAGRPRFPTVADLMARFGKRVFFAKRFIGVKSKSGRGSWQLYFWLSGGVTVHGRDVLDPALTKAEPMMVRMVQEAVDKMLK